jgi:hypothetical protein
VSSQAMAISATSQLHHSCPRQANKRQCSLECPQLLANEEVQILPEMSMVLRLDFILTKETLVSNMPKSKERKLTRDFKTLLESMFRFSSLTTPYFSLTSFML